MFNKGTKRIKFQNNTYQRFAKDLWQGKPSNFVLIHWQQVKLKIIKLGFEKSHSHLLLEMGH